MKSKMKRRVNILYDISSLNNTFTDENVVEVQVVTLLCLLHKKYS